MVLQAPPERFIQYDAVVPQLRLVPLIGKGFEAEPRRDDAAPGPPFAALAVPEELQAAGRYPSRLLLRGPRRSPPIAIPIRSIQVLMDRPMSISRVFARIAWVCRSRRIILTRPPNGTPYRTALPFERIPPGSTSRVTLCP